jgi:hypothetical protein
LDPGWKKYTQIVSHSQSEIMLSSSIAHRKSPDLEPLTKSESRLTKFTIIKLMLLSILPLEAFVTDEKSSLYMVDKLTVIFALLAV